MMRTRLTVIAFLLSVGCGSSPPPAANAPPSPGEGSPSGAGASAPSGSADAEESGDASESSDAAEPGNAPDARILAVELADSSNQKGKVKVRFSNPTASPCTYRAYTLVWSGGKKRVEGKNFVVPPGQRRQRTLRVDANDGNLGSLDAKGAWIELDTVCGAP